MFTEKERGYLKNQRLARIATVSQELQPNVAPVGYEFDGEYFYVGGLRLEATLKYKNVIRNSKVSLAIDDFESVDPWKPRGIKLHGIADLVRRSGYAGDGEYIRIRPEKVWSWGIEEETLQPDKAVMKRTTSKGSKVVVFSRRDVSGAARS
jgi:pyridoxamine 5'-phosphate oxidase family protein